jgi:hypothetical protein
MNNKLLYNSNILHPQWVVGFIDGEGCFHISIARNSTMKLGYQVSLEFTITQHIRDKELMYKFAEFFGCGYVSSDTSNKLQFRIRNRNDLANYLFPFMDNNPLLTVKTLDYADFKRVHAMLDNREHLTQEGLDLIREIAAGTNRGRK